VSTSEEKLSRDESIFPSTTVKVTSQRSLDEWIEEVKALCLPKDVHICNGSQEEYDTLCNELVQSGSFTRLNEKLFPNSFLARSNPEDVARVEACTFICSELKQNAGPTNNWQDPRQMMEKLHRLFRGAMRGRTLYVIPYCMGPLGSPMSKIGVQFTDSAYVVVNMRIMTRIGDPVMRLMKPEEAFIPCIHSVGAPLDPLQKDVPWPCDPLNRVIAHFPETRQVWSYGSGYGGNALLGKKCFALRIASVLARDEGWLAEHMLILGITNPQGEKKYIAASFPSACGKTNLAMLTPTLPGWKVETVGDDIAWMKPGPDGRLYAINPEYGFFGVAPGTSSRSNPNALASLSRNTIFTNVGLTDEGGVWWEGLTETKPSHLIDWLCNDWTPASTTTAAHPNARFTAPASQCPVIDPAWESPQGVPISAIIFGGRRSQVVPLVCESFSWQHGTFFGASVSSQMTAAAAGTIGTLRHDPFAMLPFCGYNMGDYFGHWLSIGEKIPKDKLPKIYYVNWFRRDKEEKFLWPGFGENSRVLKWIFERTSGSKNGVETPIGTLPAEGALDVSGLDISKEAMKELLTVDPTVWHQEVKELRTYFKIFGAQLPKGIADELDSLEQRIKRSLPAVENV
jgi:phosphoenolpyruvate carboxykinase (GTP)